MHKHVGELFLFHLYILRCYFKVLQNNFLDLILEDSLFS